MAKKKKIEKPIVLPISETAQAISDLTGLTLTRGWQFIKKTLELNVSNYESKILDTENASEQDKENWRKYRKVYQFVSRLPEMLIADLKEDKPTPLNLDPYEKRED